MVKEPYHATVSIRNLKTSATDIFPIRHSTATAKRCGLLHFSLFQESIVAASKPKVTLANTHETASTVLCEKAL